MIRLALISATKGNQWWITCPSRATREMGNEVELCGVHGRSDLPVVDPFLTVLTPSDSEASTSTR
jgi:hypothetical protein